MAGDKALQQALTDLDTGDAHTQAAAIDLLGERGYVPAITPLSDFLGSADGGLAFKAAGALGKIGDAMAVPILLEALRGDDLWVRAASTGALIKIGSPAVDGLIEALGDDQPAVRRSAAKALGKIGDAAAVLGLIEALDDQDRPVRRFAYEALARIGTPEALAALQKPD